MPTVGWIGGPGTTMAVLNRNPLSRDKGNRPPRADRVPLRAQARSQSLPARLGDRHRDQDAWPTSSPSTRPTPTRRCASARTCSSPPRRRAGDLSELEYRSARAMDLLAAKERGLDAYMTRHKLDAVLFPGGARRGDRGQVGLSQRAGAGRLHLGRRAARRRRTIRSASPSPAAPGARPSCCVSPTPTSRRRMPGVRRPACRRCSERGS